MVVNVADATPKGNQNRANSASTGAMAVAAIVTPNASDANPSARVDGRCTVPTTSPPRTEPMPPTACTTPSAVAPAWNSNLIMLGTMIEKLNAKVPTTVIASIPSRRVGSCHTYVNPSRSRTRAAYTVLGNISELGSTTIATSPA